MANGLQACPDPPQLPRQSTEWAGMNQVVLFFVVLNGNGSPYTKQSSDVAPESFAGIDCLIHAMVEESQTLQQGCNEAQSISHAEDTFSLNWEYADDLRNLVGSSTSSNSHAQNSWHHIASQADILHIVYRVMNAPENQTCHVGVESRRACCLCLACSCRQRSEVGRC